MKSVMIAAVAGLAVSSAVASPLLPGGSVSPVLVYANSLASGTSVTGILTSPFASPGGLFSGTLNSQVFINATDNPYGSASGYVSFVYQITNSNTSSNSLGRFTINGYGAFLTDVGSDPLSAGSIAAFEATRQIGGDSIGFSFLNAPPAFVQVGPGGISLTFVVHTNAPAWQISPASVIDGDIATAEAYSPVPTPGAGALLGMGLIAAARRRR